MKKYLTPAVAAALCCAALTGHSQATDNKSSLYTVVEGNKVDPNTMKGFRTWRTGACDRCHGANQEGMVGPSLITSLKNLSKEEFIKVVRDGRMDKGMPAFSGNAPVADNLEPLYAYLKGRSDGAIKSAKVQEIQ